MIPFYVVCGLWLLTLVAWQVREKHNSRERMEALKLYRAQSLSDYTAQGKTFTGKQNFVQTSIERAYKDLYGEEDA